jgi:hypothetical protein
MSWFSKKVKTLSVPLPAPVAEKVNEVAALAETVVTEVATEAVVLAENAVTAAVKPSSRAPHVLCAPIAYLFCLPCQSSHKLLTSEPPQVLEPVQKPSTSTAQVEVVPESKVGVSGAEPAQEKTTQASSEALLNTQTQPVL